MQNPQTVESLLFGHLYFSIQRFRGGVTRDMIRQAERLLSVPWPEVLAWVDHRLVELHRVAGPGLQWLRNQEPTDRTTVKQEMENSPASPPRRRIEIRRTSGSTGEPFEFRKDIHMTAWMDAAMWASYSWHGVVPGSPHARFWGLPRHPWGRARRRAMDALLNRRRLDAFALSESSSREFFARLRKFRPVYAHAYPTLLLAFVEHCIAAGLDGTELGIRTVICGGELLVPQTRARIADFFGCRVVDEYGCTESGLLTLECEFGAPHVLPVACFPEVLDSDGQSLGSGTGEVVITDLFGRYSPLVRYRLNDRAKIEVESACRCGRALPTLKPIFGRVQEFIRTPQKGAVYATILAYTVPNGVDRFRAYQLLEGVLVAEVILAHGADSSLIEEVRSRWSRELGPGISVYVRVVEKLEPEASGKLRYFVPQDELSASKREELVRFIGSADVT